MEQTIEERATMYGLSATKHLSDSLRPQAIQRMHDIYKAIATEQKQIDDVKYKKLRELAYAMYTKAQYLSTDGRGLRKAMENFYNYINYEEDN